LEFLDDPVFMEANDVVENLAFLKSNENFINKLLKKEIKSIIRPAVKITSSEISLVKKP